MYTLLIRFMFLTALLQLGLKISDLEKCQTSQCISKLQEKSKIVLRINWRPISVFPEEAKRFK